MSECVDKRKEENISQNELKGLQKERESDDLRKKGENEGKGSLGKIR